MVTLNSASVNVWKGNQMRGKSVHKHGKFITCDVCNGPPTKRDKNRLTYSGGLFKCSDCLIGKTEEEDLAEARDNAAAKFGPSSGIALFENE